MMPPTQGSHGQSVLATLAGILLLSFDLDLEIRLFAQLPIVLQLLVAHL